MRKRGCKKNLPLTRALALTRSDLVLRAEMAAVNIRAVAEVWVVAHNVQDGRVTWKATVLDGDSSRTYASPDEGAALRQATAWVRQQRGGGDAVLDVHNVDDAFVVPTLYLERLGNAAV